MKTEGNGLLTLLEPRHPYEKGGVDGREFKSWSESGS